MLLCGLCSHGTANLLSRDVFFLKEARVSWACGLGWPEAWWQTGELWGLRAGSEGRTCRQSNVTCCCVLHLQPGCSEVLNSFLLPNTSQAEFCGADCPQAVVVLGWAEGIFPCLRSCVLWKKKRKKTDCFPVQEAEFGSPCMTKPAVCPDLWLANR